MKYKKLNGFEAEFIQVFTDTMTSSETSNKLLAMTDKGACLVEKGDTLEFELEGEVEIPMNNLNLINSDECSLSKEELRVLCLQLISEKKYINSEIFNSNYRLSDVVAIKPESLSHSYIAVPYPAEGLKSKTSFYFILKKNSSTQEKSIYDFEFSDLVEAAPE